MEGNVAEWCCRLARRARTTRRSRRLRRLAGRGAAGTPGGRQAGEQRVVRGGSWVDDTSFLRVSRRYFDTPATHNGFIGFRCARDAPPGAAASGSACGLRPREHEAPRPSAAYVHVPPGAFEMGCVAGDRECQDDEKPSRRVELTQGFWLGRTEVTVAAFRRVRAAPPATGRTRRPTAGAASSTAGASSRRRA